MTDKPNEKSTSIDQASLAKETEEIERAIAKAMGETPQPAKPAEPATAAAEPAEPEPEPEPEPGAARPGAVEPDASAVAAPEVEARPHADADADAGGAAEEADGEPGAAGPPVYGPSDSEAAETDPDTDETTADETTVDGTTADEPVEPAGAAPRERRFKLAKVMAFGVLPVLVVALIAAAGWLTYLGISTSTLNTARDEAVQTAKDSTAVLLTYQPDTVEQQLTDARNLLTGEFLDSYTAMTTDMVIPGAKQQRITAVATVPRAAAVSVEPKRVVALVFVNQTVSVGEEAPSQSLSSVRVTLEKLDGKWLISKFEPV